MRRVSWATVWSLIPPHSGNTGPCLASGDATVLDGTSGELGLSEPERRIGLSAHDFTTLAAQPRIVLADEPTANLDHKTGEGILALMKDINVSLGTTFIFSTHDKKVMARADRLVRIEDGQIRMLGVRADARWLVVDERRRRTERAAQQAAREKA